MASGHIVPVPWQQMTLSRLSRLHDCALFSPTQLGFVATLFGSTFSLGDSGEEGRLTVAKFSYEGEASPHCLHIFAQRREQEI